MRLQAAVLDDTCSHFPARLRRTPAHDASHLMRQMLNAAARTQHGFRRERDEEKYLQSLCRDEASPLTKMIAPFRDLILTQTAPAGTWTSPSLPGRHHGGRYPACRRRHQGTDPMTNLPCHMSLFQPTRDATTNMTPAPAMSGLLLKHHVAWHVWHIRNGRLTEQIFAAAVPSDKHIPSHMTSSRCRVAVGIAQTWEIALR